MQGNGLPLAFLTPTAKTNMSRLLRLAIRLTTCCALFALMALHGPSVFAQTTTTWTGSAGDGLWATSGNWDNGVPNATSHIAVFSSNATVTTPASDLTIGALRVTGTANVTLAPTALTIADRLLTVGSTAGGVANRHLTVDAGARLTLKGVDVEGSVDRNLTLVLNTNTALARVEGTFVLGQADLVNFTGVGGVTLNTGTRFSFATGAVLEWARNGGSIPTPANTADWDSVTFRVTGVYTTAPTFPINNNGRYFDYVYDSPNTSAAVTLLSNNAVTVNVLNDFKILNTGTGSVSLQNNNQTLNLNVRRDVVVGNGVNAANFYFRVSNQTNTINLRIGRNLTVNANATIYGSPTGTNAISFGDGANTGSTETTCTISGTGTVALNSYQSPLIGGAAITASNNASAAGITLNINAPIGFVSTITANTGNTINIDRNFSATALAVSGTINMGITQAVTAQVSNFNFGAGGTFSMAGHADNSLKIVGTGHTLVSSSYTFNAGTGNQTVTYASTTTTASRILRGVTYNNLIIDLGIGLPSNNTATTNEGTFIGINKIMRLQTGGFNPPAGTTLNMATGSKIQRVDGLFSNAFTFNPVSTYDVEYLTPNFLFAAAVGSEWSTNTAHVGTVILDCGSNYWTLPGNRTINTGITFTSGYLYLNNLTLTLASGVTHTGASASSHLVTNGQGYVRRTGTTAANYQNFVFPIGTVATYAPVTVENTFSPSGLSTSSYLGVRTVGSRHPFTAGHTAYVNRFWAAEHANMTFANLNLQVSWAAGEVTGTISGGRYRTSTGNNFSPLSAFSLAGNTASLSTPAQGSFTTGSELFVGDESAFASSNIWVLTGAAWGTGANWQVNGVPQAAAPVSGTGLHIVLNTNVAITGNPATFSCASFSVMRSSGANPLATAMTLTTTGDWMVAAGVTLASNSSVGGNVVVSSTAALTVNGNLNFTSTGNQEIIIAGGSTGTATHLVAQGTGSTRTVYVRGYSPANFNNASIGANTTVSIANSDPSTGVTFSGQFIMQGGGTNGILRTEANRVLTFTGTTPQGTGVTASNADFSAAGSRVRYANTSGTQTMLAGTYQVLEIAGDASNRDRALPANATVTVLDHIELRNRARLIENTAGGSILQLGDGVSASTANVIWLSESGQTNATVNLATGGTQANHGTLRIYSHGDIFPLAATAAFFTERTLQAGTVLFDAPGVRSIKINRSLSATREIQFNNANGGADSVVFNPSVVTAFPMTGTTAVNVTISGANPGVMQFAGFRLASVASTKVTISRNINITGNQTGTSNNGTDAAFGLAGAASGAGPELNIADGATVTVRLPNNAAMITGNQAVPPVIKLNSTGVLEFDQGAGNYTQLGIQAGNTIFDGGTVRFKSGYTGLTQGNAFIMTGRLEHNVFTDFATATVQFNAASAYSSGSPNITGTYGPLLIKGSLTIGGSFASYSNIDITQGLGSSPLTVNQDLNMGDNTMYFLKYTNNNTAALTGTAKLNAYNLSFEGNTVTNNSHFFSANVDVRNTFAVTLAGVRVGTVGAARTVKVKDLVIGSSGTIGGFNNGTLTASAVSQLRVSNSVSNAGTISTATYSNSGFTHNLDTYLAADDTPVGQTFSFSGAGTSTFNNLIIGDHASDVVNWTASGTTSVNTDLTGTSGATLNATAGTFQWTATPATDNMVGSAGLNLTFNNLTLGNANSAHKAALGTNATVNGLFSMTSNGSTTGYFALNGFTLTLNGNYSRSNSGQFKADADASTNGTSGLVLNGSGTNSTNFFFMTGFRRLNKLTHNKTANNATVNDNIVIGGNSPVLSLQAGALGGASGRYTLANNATIERGLGSVGATNFISTTGASRINLRYIDEVTTGTGNEIPAGSHEIAKLSIAAGSGKNVTLNSGFTIDSLVFESGKLLLGANNLLIDGAGAPFVGGTASSYAVYDGAGVITQSSTGNLSAFNVVWPVGSSTNYLPATISGLPASSAAARTLSLSFLAGPAEDADAPSLALQRTFRLVGTGFSTLPSGDVSFTYADGDVSGTESNYTEVRYKVGGGTSWTLAAGQSITIASNTFGASLAGLADMTNDWVLGAPNAFSITRFYSKAGSLNFHLPSSWTMDEAGTVAAVTTPGSGDMAVVQTTSNLSISSPVTIATTLIRGILDAGATSSVNLGGVIGTGTLRRNTGSLPAGDYSYFTSADSGSVEFYGTSSYSLPASQTTYNNLIFSNNAGVISSGADFSLNGNLTANGTTSFSHGVTFNNADGYILGNSAINLADVTIPAGKVVEIFNGAGAGFGGALSGTGSVQVNSNAKFSFKAASMPYTLIMNGSSHTVTLNGTVNQAVPAVTYENLAVDNSAGVTLAGATTVNGTLTMTNGNITLGNFNLTVGTNLVNSSPSASRMIVTNGTGSLLRSVTDPSALSLSFPVGVAGNLSTFNFSNLNGTGTGTISVRAVSGLNSFRENDNLLGRYFALGSTGVTINGATISGSYPESEVNGTEANYEIRYFNSGFLSLGGTSTVDEAANTFTASLGAIGNLNYEFVIGETSALSTLVRTAVAALGNWSNASTWDGGNAIDPSLKQIIIIPNGTAVTLDQNVNFTNATGQVLVQVQSGGHLITPFNTALSGTLAAFELQSGGTLTVQDSAGIYAVGTNRGPIRTTAGRSFASNAHYIYSYNGVAGTRQRLGNAFPAALTGTGSLTISTGGITAGDVTAAVSSANYHSHTSFSNALILDRNLVINDDAQVTVNTGGVLDIRNFQITGTGTKAVAIGTAAMLRVGIYSRAYAAAIPYTSGLSFATVAPYSDLHLYDIVTGTTHTSNNLYPANLRNLVVHSIANVGSSLDPASDITINNFYTNVRGLITKGSRGFLAMANGATIYKMMVSGVTYSNGAITNSAITFPNGSSDVTNIIWEHNGNTDVRITNSEVPSLNSNLKIGRFIIFGSSAGGLFFNADAAFNITGQFYFNSPSSIRIDGGGANSGIKMALSGPINLASNLTFGNSSAANAADAVLGITGSGAITGTGRITIPVNTFRRLVIDRPGVAVPISGTVSSTTDTDPNVAGLGGNLELTQGSIDLAGNNLTVEGALILGNNTGSVASVTGTTGQLILAAKSNVNVSYPNVTTPITSYNGSSVDHLTVSNALGAELVRGSDLTIAAQLTLTNPFSFGTTGAATATVLRYNGASVSSGAINGSSTAKIIFGGSNASVDFPGLTTAKTLHVNNTAPGTVNMAGTVAVSDSIILQNGGFNFNDATLANNQHVVRYLNNGTSLAGAVNLNVPNVTYLAGALSSITTSDELPGTIQGLTLDAASSTVNMGISALAADALTLTDGVFNLGTGTLTYFGNSMPVSESNSYIATNSAAGSGGFQWSPLSVSAGSYTIPVGPTGTVGGYRPVKVQVPAFTGNIVFSFRNHAANGTAADDEVPLTGNTRAGYIAKITNNTGGAVSATVGLEAATGDFNNTPSVNLSDWSIFKWSGSQWLRQGQSLRGSRASTGATYIERSNVSLGAGLNSLVLGINGGTDLIAVPVNFVWQTASGNGSWNTTASWLEDGAAASRFPDDATDIVTIDPSVTVAIDHNSPVAVDDLTISSGSTLQIASGNTLRIVGDITNNGTFQPLSGSAVAYTGANQTVLGGTYSSLDLRGAAAVTKTFGSAVTVNDTLYLSTGVAASGTLNIATGATIKKEASAAGTGQPLASAPAFAGNVNVELSGAQTAGHELPATVSKLTINTLGASNSVVLPNSVTVSGQYLQFGQGLVMVGDQSTTPVTVTFNGGIQSYGLTRLRSFHANTGRLFINGSNALPNERFISAVNPWNRITINNSHATDNVVILGDNSLTVNELNIVDGRLSMGNATLTVESLTATSPDGPFLFTSATNLATGSTPVSLPNGTSVNNLTVGSGGASISGSGNTVTIGGTPTFNGGFTVGANTLALNGTSVTGAGGLVTTAASSLSVGGSQLTVNLPASVTSLNNLTINNSNQYSFNQLVNLGANLTVNGTLTLTSGSLGINGQTLTLLGDVAATNGCISGSSNSNLVVAGTGSLPSNITFGPSGAGRNLGNLTLDRPGANLAFMGFVPVIGLSLTPTVNGEVTITSGTLDGSNMIMANASTITMDGGSFQGPFNNSTNIPLGRTVNYRYTANAGNTVGTEFVTSRVRNLEFVNSSLTLTGGTTIAGNLTLPNAGTLLNGGAAVSLFGDLYGNGSISGVGTFFFSGSSAQTVQGSPTLTNVTFNNSAGIAVASGQTLTIDGTAAFTGGTVNISDAGIALNNTFSRTSGTLRTNSASNITFGGTSAQTVPSSFFFSAPASVNNLTINNTAGVTMGNQSVAAGGVVSFANGAGMLRFSNTGTLLNLGTTGSLSNEGAGRYVLGRTRATRVMNMGANDMRLGVTINSVTNATATLLNSQGGSFRVDRVAGVSAGSGNNSEGLSSNQGIKRIWEFTGVGALPNPVALSLNWVSDDDNRGDCPTCIENMVAYYRTNSSSDWVKASTSPANADLGSGLRGLTIQATSFTDYTFGYDDLPLPVSLSYFTGRREQKDVRLMWQTASEKNASHFEVQRSFDNRSFETIGRVDAAGNSSKLINYQFVDANAAARKASVIYYRLHQVDRDGRSENSATVAINLESEQTLGMSVKPQPFSSHLDLSFSANQRGTATVTLQDLTGRTFFSRELGVEEGVNAIRLDDLGAGLTNGVYILKLDMGTQTEIKRIMKQ